MWPTVEEAEGKLKQGQRGLQRGKGTHWSKKNWPVRCDIVADEPKGMEYGRQDYVAVRQPLQVSSPLGTQLRMSRISGHTYCQWNP